VYYFGVDHAFAQRARQRERVETEVIHISRNAFREFSDGPVSFSSEEGTALVAGNAQPVLNVILDFPGRGQYFTRSGFGR